MKKLSPSKKTAWPRESETKPDNSGYAFKIAVVFQDTLTKSWATQICHQVTRQVGEENVQNTWNNINSLGDPEILAEAVRATIAADVIVVAVHAAEELPPELCAWIDAWLPRRLARVGALAALIGVNEQPASQALRTQEYLQAVARRGQLDFLPHERQLPSEPGVSPTQPMF